MLSLFLTIQNENDRLLAEMLYRKYKHQMYGIAYSILHNRADAEDVVMDSVYKKVKNGVASNFEKNALSTYYTIVRLKDNEYLESAANSLFEANADRMVQERCRARREAERRERTMERDIKLLKDENNTLKEKNDTLEARIKELELQLSKS